MFLLYYQFFSVYFILFFLHIFNMETKSQICLDCNVNKADPTILAYYQVCRPCYNLTVKALLQYKNSRTQKYPQINLIQSNLYLGNQDAATEKSILDKYNIKAVLACGHHLLTPFQSQIVYKSFQIADSTQQNILPYFDQAFQWIQNQHKLGNNILVHCAAGVSRSASFVIAYKMRKSGKGFEQSYQYVKKKRQVIRPNSGFKSQLKQYERKIILDKFD